MREGLGVLVSGADRGAERLLDAARDLRRSPALHHGLAARARGNLEAAFWLLAEEHELRPDDLEVTVAYWNVAVDLDRVEVAAPVGVELVQRHAEAGEIDLAAQYWVELVAGAPEALVAPTALARMMPVLRRRALEASAGDRTDARMLARRAMRNAVDPRNEGLGAGVALRLFEEGREVNPEAARRAAEVALESPNLHEAKRARLLAFMQGRNPDAASEESGASST